MTTREAAAYLRISEDYLCRLAGAGSITAFKVGRSWRFDPAELATAHVPAAPALQPRLPVVAPAPPPAAPATRAKRSKPASRSSSLRERVKAHDPYADLKRAS